MMRSPWVVGVALVVAAAGGCEKSDSTGKSVPGMSAPQRSAESVLMHDLPKGNQLLFGGNFLRLQKVLQDSPLGKLAMTMTTQTPGMVEWQSCFIDGPGLAMMGSVNFADREIEMRYVMSGLDLSGVEACAKRAGFPSTMDPDHKFLAIEVASPMGTLKVGYLALPDGALITQQGLPLGVALGKLPATDRASLETLTASLAHGTAADDTELVHALAGLDHDKAMWIVASGAGTPLADKLGLVSGTFDIRDGLALDFTAQLTDRALGDKLESGIAMAKKQAGSLGPDVGAIAENIHVERSGDKVHVTVAVTNPQLKAFADRVAPMLQAPH